MRYKIEEFNNFESADDFLQDAVSRWTEEDCIAFLKSHDLEDQRSMCEDALIGQFTDCGSVLDLQDLPGLNLEFIKSPKKAQELKQGKKQ